LTLAGELHGRLQSPRTLGPLRAWNGLKQDQLGWAVTGHWNLRTHGEDGRTRVWLAIEISGHWFSDPPRVRTNASFLRRVEDWHAYSDGGLCHILLEEWVSRFAEMEKLQFPLPVLVDHAATWTLAAADSLITRHLHAHTAGIIDWPHVWTDWSHGDEGVRQFREEEKRRKRSA